MKIAVVGAGPAGLSAAWELKHLGFSVDIFEAHSKPGGCASYFRRKVGLNKEDETKVLFDAGATVLWELKDGEFLNSVLNRWGLQLPPFTQHVEHRFSIDTKNTTNTFILESTSEASWINALVKNFPQDEPFIRKDFPHFFKVARLLNSTLYKIPAEPFLELNTLTQNLSLWRELIQLVPSLLKYPRSFSKLIQNYSDEFKSWANSLLLITLQANAEVVESLYGISALCFFPLGAGALEGGMASLFDTLAKKFPTNSCHLFFRTPIKHISRDKGYTLHTPMGSYSGYSHVLLSTPRWNSSQLFEENIFPNNDINSWQKNKDKLWSAVVAYLVINDEPSLPSSAFNHLVKNHEGDFYFSVSQRNDLRRALPGLRIITASTHEKLENWNYTNYQKKKVFDKRNQYEAQKDLWLRRFKTAAKNVFSSELVFSEIASPKTFLAYTHRIEGFVGGIPLTREFSFLNSPTQATLLPNVLQIGDTAFPGQSVVNCTVGALEAVRKVLRSC
ncbi:MAG: FAD-dependent oxidoreductase [Bdellovibrionota bacterium]